MPDSSRTAGEIVRDVIQRDAVIRNGLARGLINVRALARYIQVTTREDTTFEALVGAVRRFPVKETTVDRQAIGRLIGKLEMKNKIVEVAIRNDPEIPTLLAKFSGEVDYGRGETLSIVSGVKDVIVVVDSTNLSKLIGVISKKSVISVDHGLAAVNLSYTKATWDTVGVLATVFTEIAIEGISIREIIDHGQVSTLLVNERDALRAYQALEGLANEAREFQG